ncbi:hypothetical protein LIG30_2042 [Burkholderia sp. lig30]|jgi:hypothetical protein|nr:hypothetical protein LIG30_2042 [Burkholderia sp. lig30]
MSQWGIEPTMPTTSLNGLKLRTIFRVLYCRRKGFAVHYYSTYRAYCRTERVNPGGCRIPSVAVAASRTLARLLHSDTEPSR